jgi:hypothetical protein
MVAAVHSDDNEHHRNADVIHTLRKLAREIHRRSVWQVLGVYGLLSWSAYMAVGAATRALGLPLWTPDMAAALLVIGTPVVIATAVVQGGLPGLRMVDEIDPNAMEGRTPAEVLVVPEDHPLHGIGLFTWRNAVLGGVMAGALLVTSVTSYLAMWALGIGPVGSLLAQGILVEQDAIVVADFGDAGADAELAAFIGEALRVELSRSSVVSVLDPEAVLEALVRMGRGPDAAFGTEVARDPPALEGEALIIDGGVLREGEERHVFARIVLPDGTQLARFQEAIDEESTWSPTVMLLSDKLRERFGESLRTIRAGRAATAAVGSRG